MSKLRSVNTHFWDDTFTSDLDPIEKLLFLYLLTNPNTNMLGVYELSLRRISFDTGIDKDMVVKIFDRFSLSKKVFYKYGFVILSNFLKNQNLNNNMKKGAVTDFNALPNHVKTCEEIESVRKALKGFERLRKIEIEIEREIEIENEGEGEIKPTTNVDIISIKNLETEDDLKSVAKRLFSESSWLQLTMKNLKIKPKEIKKYLLEFVEHRKMTSENDFVHINELKKHFVSWYRKNETRLKTESATFNKW